MKRERGFTLVELMIVVAIIAILAAIAIPMYSGYVKKAKISEALTGIDAIKSAVVVYYQKNGAFPATNTTISDLGVHLDQTKWTYSITTSGNNCTIKATATDQAGSGLSGGYVYITGTANEDGSISWSSPAADGTTIKNSDLP